MRNLLLSLAAVFSATSATAQSLSVGAEATTDERRRGLSWSDGEAALSGDAAASVSGIDGSLRVVSTRGSSRHAGADAVADISLGTGWRLGGFDLRARGIGHLFAGAAIKADYWEVGGDASYTLGPAQVTAGAIYAPDQRAIGGDNLYLHAGATAGIPTTPVTLLANIGRSSGDSDDAVRAARLRPAGSYTDWRIGMDYVLGPVTLGLDYVGNDIARNRIIASPFADPRHSGDKIVGRVRVGL